MSSAATDRSSPELFIKLPPALKGSPLRRQDAVTPRSGVSATSPRSLDDVRNRGVGSAARLIARPRSAMRQQLDHLNASKSPIEMSVAKGVEELETQLLLKSDQLGILRSTVEGKMIHDPDLERETRHGEWPRLAVEVAEEFWVKCGILFFVIALALWVTDLTLYAGGERFEGGGWTCTDICSAPGWEILTDCQYNVNGRSSQARDVLLPSCRDPPILEYYADAAAGASPPSFALASQNTTGACYHHSIVDTLLRVLPAGVPCEASPNATGVSIPVPLRGGRTRAVPALYSVGTLLVPAGGGGNGPSTPAAAVVFHPADPAPCAGAVDIAQPPLGAAWVADAAPAFFTDFHACLHLPRQGGWVEGGWGASLRNASAVAAGSGAVPTTAATDPPAPAVPRITAYNVSTSRGRARASYMEWGGGITPSRVADTASCLDHPDALNIGSAACDPHPNYDATQSVVQLRGQVPLSAWTRILLVTARVRNDPYKSRVSALAVAAVTARDAGLSGVWDDDVDAAEVYIEVRVDGLPVKNLTTRLRCGSNGEEYCQDIPVLRVSDTTEGGKGYGLQYHDVNVTFAASSATRLAIEDVMFVSESVGFAYTLAELVMRLLLVVLLVALLLLFVWRRRQVSRLSSPQGNANKQAPSAGSSAKQAVPAGPTEPIAEDDDSGRAAPRRDSYASDDSDAYPRSPPLADVDEDNNPLPSEENGIRHLQNWTMLFLVAVVLHLNPVYLLTVFSRDPVNTRTRVGLWFEYDASYFGEYLFLAHFIIMFRFARIREATKLPQDMFVCAIIAALLAVFVIGIVSRVREGFDNFSSTMLGLEPMQAQVGAIIWFLGLSAAAFQAYYARTKLRFTHYQSSRRRQLLLRLALWPSMIVAAALIITYVLMESRPGRVLHTAHADPDFQEYGSGDFPEHRRSSMSFLLAVYAIMIGAALLPFKYACEPSAHFKSNWLRMLWPQGLMGTVAEMPCPPYFFTSYGDELRWNAVQEDTDGSQDGGLSNASMASRSPHLLSTTAPGFDNYDAIGTVRSDGHATEDEQTPTREQARPFHEYQLFNLQLAAELSILSQEVYFNPPLRVLLRTAKVLKGRSIGCCVMAAAMACPHTLVGMAMLHQNHTADGGDGGLQIDELDGLRSKLLMEDPNTQGRSHPKLEVNITPDLAPATPTEAVQPSPRALPRPSSSFLLNAGVGPSPSARSVSRASDRPFEKCDTMPMEDLCAGNDNASDTASPTAGDSLARTYGASKSPPWVTPAEQQPRAALASLSPRTKKPTFMTPLPRRQTVSQEPPSAPGTFARARAFFGSAAGAVAEKIDPLATLCDVEDGDDDDGTFVLDKSSKQFSENVSRSFMDLSYVKWRLVSFVDRADNRAIVAVKTLQKHGKRVNMIAVVFRGTRNKTNLQTDLNFLTDPYEEMRHRFGDVKWGEPYPKVHKGFSNTYAVMKDAILSSVEAQIKEYRRAEGELRVIFSGHSLGGALSTLAAYTISQRHPELWISVYTFACPRIGNPTFCRFFKEAVPDCYGIVHPADPVPPHPPAFSFFFFRPSYSHGHCRKVRADSYGNLIINMSWLENLLLHHLPFSLFDPFEPKENMKEGHSMRTYRFALKMACNFMGEDFGLQTSLEKS